MEEYKCPICGGKESVEVAVFSKGTGVCIKKFGSCDNFGRCLPNCNLDPRGLINWGTKSYGDGHTDIIFSPQVSTKLCTKCGFVSFHALELAKAVAKDLVMIEEKDAELLAEKEKLLDEKTTLSAQLDAIPEQEGKLEELIKSEDITIRQQKEYQSELAGLRDRKWTIGGRIGDINSRIKEIDYNRGLLSDAKKHVNGNTIDKILSYMK